MIGADKLSSIVNWTRPQHLRALSATARAQRDSPVARAGSHGVITTFMGQRRQLWRDPAHSRRGGCAIPVTKENFDQRLNTLHMNGRETFKQAVTSMLSAANRALQAERPFCR